MIIVCIFSYKNFCGVFLFKNDLLFVYLLFNLGLTSVYPARLH